MAAALAHRSASIQPAERFFICDGGHGLAALPDTSRVLLPLRGRDTSVRCWNQPTNMHTILCMFEEDETEHYRDQATRLRIMALVLGGAELKAHLRTAARMYDGFAEKLDAYRFKAGSRVLNS